MSAEHGGHEGGGSPSVLPESGAGELVDSVMKDLTDVFTVFSLLLASVGWKDQGGGGHDGGHH